jgi:hypothetical protein
VVIRRLAGQQNTLLLFLILAAGAALRLYGLNWDGGQWLQPDERQIYFVTLGLAWPHSLAEALSASSPLNPHFFAYGSLPFYLLKLVAALLAPLWPALRDSDNMHLAGRPLATLFDLGTVVLTYRLAQALLAPSREQGRKASALFAAALISLAVLHVQLAHFYTVDPLLTFFVMLALNLAADVARGGGRGRQAALGAAFGLALATKVSAAPLVVVVLVAYNERLSGNGGRAREGMPSNPAPPVSRLGHLAAVGRPVAWTLLVAGIVFVVTQPYAVIDWPAFLDDTVRESQIASGVLDVPYTRQYAGTLPYLTSGWQAALWGLALPVGLVAWAGFGLALIRWLRRAAWADTLLLSWAGPYLAITGLLYTRYLRYTLPLVPVLCILAVRLLTSLERRGARGKRSSRIGYWLLGIASLAYVLDFASLYSAPHTWIEASEWIYREVPAGSSLAVEDWDVALPLPLDLDGQPRRIEEYDVRTLGLYDEPDDAAKWETLARSLADSDYVIIASRRLYGSIPRLARRYRLTTQYYEELFAGTLGFELAEEFSRGPEWLNPRVPPLPGAAPTFLLPDESFVVYDHPRTLIFRNVEGLSAEELLGRLGVQ